MVASNPATMANAATRATKNRCPDRRRAFTWEERLMAAPADLDGGKA
jgi:hypothetical protein